MANKKLTDVDLSALIQDTDSVFGNFNSSVKQISFSNLVTIIKNKIGSLKNPHKITFIGMTNAEYDGSEAVTVNIPVAFQRNQETIFPTANGQLTFTLTKGTYTVGAHYLDVVIDGVPQPHSSFTEVDESTFQLKDGFQTLTTTQIDVTYMKSMSNGGE